MNILEFLVLVIWYGLQKFVLYQVLFSKSTNLANVHEEFAHKNILQEYLSVNIKVQ